MEEIKTTLWNDYKAVSNQINATNDSNNDNIKLLFEERDKIRNELIKLEQTEIEADLKKRQMEIEVKNKEVQITAENSREKIRNQITIGTFTVTTMVSLYTIIRTFNFDKTATVTSTLGRNILSGAIPKLFKRWYILKPRKGV